jgi:protease-4
VGILALVVFLFVLSMLGSLYWLDRTQGRGWGWFESAKVGVVEVRGVILDVKETLESIRDFREDDGIQAIIVRIESPGGGVGPSQEIYQELRQTLTRKPVVASLGSVAASGGYYIASACQYVVANPGTITGSIGVIAHFANLEDLFGKVGYRMVTIKSGEFKDIGNPARPMTPEEQAMVQAMIDDVHRQFVRDVAGGRHMEERDVGRVADGRALTGEAAKGLGLVDELGNFQDAVNAASRLAHLEAEPDLVYAEKKKYALLDLLLGTEIMEQLRMVLQAPRHPLRYQLPFPW